MIPAWLYYGAALVVGLIALGLTLAVDRCRCRIPCPTCRRRMGWILSGVVVCVGLLIGGCAI